MKKSNRTEKSVSRIIIWQFLGVFWGQAIGIITAPIFTRLLSTSDYGNVSSFTSWVSIIGIFIGLQLGGTIGIAKNKLKENQFDSYCSSILFLNCVVFCAVFVVAFAFRNLLANLMEIGTWMVPIMIIYSFALYILNFFNTKLEFEFKVEVKTIITISLSILTIASSILLIDYYDEARYLGKIFGMMIPTIVIAIVQIAVIFCKGRTLVNSAHWNFGLSLAIPLIFHSAAGIILARSDVIMIKKLVGDSDTGVYSIAYSLVAVLDAIWMAFNHSWVPFYYKFKKESDYNAIREKSKGYRFVYTIITIGFMLCSPEVFRIITPEEYWEGLYVVPLIACANYINFLYSFPANHEFYNEKTKIISYATVGAAAVNIIMNAILIPRYKSIGAAFASIVCFFVCFIFHDICARYFIKNFEISISFYIKGIIPVAVATLAYYSMMPYIVFRWGLAAILAVVVLIRIFKNRSIF